MVALRPARVRVELPESVEKLLEVAHAAIACDLQALSALSLGTSLILTSTSLQPYHVPELYGVEQNAVLVADFELHTVDLFLLEDHLGHHLFGRPPSLASCVFQRRKVHALDVSLVDVVGFDMEKKSHFIHLDRSDWTALFLSAGDMLRNAAVGEKVPVHAGTEAAPGDPWKRAVPRRYRGVARLPKREGSSRPLQGGEPGHGRPYGTTLEKLIGRTDADFYGRSTAEQFHGPEVEAMVLAGPRPSSSDF